MVPADVQYLEAHGTGTKFGDTIELQAAAAVLGQGRAEDRPLLVGSVKANIGHLESAGGISGLIKVVLSMNHGVIPRQLHFDPPNPDIPWEQLPVRVVTEPTPWPTTAVRTAGITALGMSGTNAHILLTAEGTTADSPEDSSSLKGSPNADPGDSPPRPCHLLVLSGRTPDAICRLADRYHEFFTASPDVNLADACYTAGVGRRHFEHRAALVVESVAQTQHLLDALRSEGSAEGCVTGQASNATKIGWIYPETAVDAVYPGREFYDTQPIFREALDQCDGLLQDELGGSLVDLLFIESADDRERWAQPALFTLQMALDRLWRSGGIEPDVICGIGWGQYAAACAAGVMTWESGLRLVTQASRRRPDAAANSETDFWNEFENFADTLDYFPADRPLICSLSGEVVPEHRLLAGRYWRRHATEPHRITAGLGTLAELACDFVMEMGPPSADGELAGPQADVSLPPRLPSLGTAVSETAGFLTSLGQLYVSGLNPNFAGLDKPWPRKKAGLPTYPFDRRRYWITDVAQHASPRPGGLE